MKTKRTKSEQTELKASPPTPIPAPAATLEQAKNEPRIVAARDYIETINTLRDQKSFSFREIASWLNARGVPLDNNEIYRAYIADMSWQEKQAIAHQGKGLDPED
jgi:hypothetical protein